MKSFLIRTYKATMTGVLAVAVGLLALALVLRHGPAKAERQLASMVHGLKVTA
jgi:hypothetical protein